MFKRILIANRGEIACRVIRTVKRMGIATVAVYSDADEDALHVGMADQAVLIGPSPAVQSYLSIEAVIAACQQTGAEVEATPGVQVLGTKHAGEASPIGDHNRTADRCGRGGPPGALSRLCRRRA